MNLLTASLKLTKSISKDDFKKGDVMLPDGTYISNGHLVLCDNNNRRLLVLDDNYRCVEEYTNLDTEPCGICIVQQGGDDVLYVTSISTNTVQVITHNKQGWSLTRSLSTDTDVGGVACVGETLITCHHDKVVVQSLSGNTKKEWSRQGDGPFVAVSPQGDRFYYTDNNDVVCRGLQDGTVHWNYQHEKLEDPAGICTDPQGNVYVVGNSSNNIHQISADGATHRILVNTVQNMAPIGIVFHPHRNMFIVTSYWGNVPIQEYTFNTSG